MPRLWRWFVVADTRREVSRGAVLARSDPGTGMRGACVAPLLGAADVSDFVEF